MVKRSQRQRGTPGAYGVHTAYSEVQACSTARGGRIGTVGVAVIRQMGAVPRDQQYKSSTRSTCSLK